MPKRTLASGSDFMCFLRGGTEGAYTYRPIAGQTNVSLDPQTADFLESTAKNFNGWKGRKPNLKDWTASVDIDLIDESDVDANEVDYNELIDLTYARTPAYFVFAWVTPQALGSDAVVLDTTKRMYGGEAFVSAPIAAPAGDKATSTVTLTANFELEVIDPS